MCGICGYYSWPNESVLGAMLERLVHRGPNEEGRFQAPGIGLAIRRLSIIDVKGGSQPIANEDASVHLVLNGEIYNFRELRDELVKKGHRFATNSDTESIVHLYEEDGEECFSRLRGMFAVALWDAREQKLLLARDKLGIKPLYYTDRGGAVAFASELTALRAVMSSAEIRPSAIAEYLTFLYVPGPRTIYADVKQLMPGEMARITAKGMTVRRYFTMREFAALQPPFRPDDAAEQFRETLKESVKVHLISDVPLGLFLSGGVDSGSILAMMRAITDGPIKTFSIGYEAQADHGFNETTTSRLLAQQFGTSHTEEMVRPDATSILDAIVGAMNEPFADASMIPTYLVSQIASRSVTVALSGVGGDELFGGYPRYLGMQAAAAYQHLPRAVRWSVGSWVPSHLPEKGSHADHLGRLKRFIAAGSLPLDEQYLRWVTFIPQQWSRSAFSQEYRQSLSFEEPADLYRPVYHDWASPVPADRAMALDMRTYLPDDLLRMGDRMSMAHSLELRVPFCDEKLLAFALSLPASIRLKGFRLKSFMKSALQTVLPAEVIRGPKRGFMVPIARWLREDLREMTADLLCETSIRRRGYVEPGYVQWLLSEHQSGKRNFSDQIFSLLVLERWLRMQEERPTHS